MFKKIKEIRELRMAEKECALAEERNRLMSLSEKELLVEIIMELKNVEDRLSDVKRAIRVYSD